MAEGGPSGSSETPIIIDDDDIDIDVEPVGIVNIWELQHHKYLIEDALHDFKRCIESGSIKDVMKQLVEEFKSIITRVYLAMEEADIIAVL